MKKWIAGIVVLLILLLTAIYAIIPGRMDFEREKTIHVNAKAFLRIMKDPASWNWWPGERNANEFLFRERGYKVNGVTVNSLYIDQVSKDDTLHAELLLVPTSKDEVEVSWKGSRALPLMPWNRWADYNRVKAGLGDMDALLVEMKKHFSDPHNLYETNIREEHVKDSILVSTFTVAKDSPDVHLIYSMIGKLQNYVAKNKAHETGPPMLNITRNETGFRTQVALPVDRRLPDQGDIQYKWMLGGGNILVSDIHGGPAAIKKGMHQLELYVQDHNRVAPAISFQSLLTDRSKEMDTAKWVTRLYYPVM
jgi:hypothetical protein